MSNGQELSELWDAIMDWAERTGAAPLNKHPGVLSVPLAHGYEMHLNGHREPMPAQIEGQLIRVLPFHAVLLRTGCRYIAMIYCDAFEATLIGGVTMRPFIEAIRATESGR